MTIKLISCFFFYTYHRSHVFLKLVMTGTEFTLHLGTVIFVLNCNEKFNFYNYCCFFFSMELAMLKT